MGIIKTPTHKRNGDQKNKLAEYFKNGIKVTADLKIDSSIYALAFSPDGNRIAAAGGDGKVRIYDASKGGALVKEFVPVPITDASS